MADDVQDPFGIFEEEHRHALAQLEWLEQAIDGLGGGRNLDDNLGQVRRAHAFLSSAVRAHNEHEEQALFPYLGDEAPTQLFIQEHGRLRELERELLAALEHDDAPNRVIEPAREVIDLLRAHIHREDEALFPMARAMLGSDGTARVARELDRLMGLEA